MIVGAMANRFGDVHCSQMEYSGVLEGSGIDLDVSAEVEVETQPLQDPGPPTASSTPAKVMPFLCSHCGKGYKYRQGLRAHVKASHENGYICYFCDKTFSNKTLLDSHLNGHNLEKPHTCEYCGKSYQSRNSLSEHKCRTQNHQCKECGKLFHTGRALRQHMLSHDDKAQYACPHCVKNFKHRQSRDRHVKTCRLA